MDVGTGAWMWDTFIVPLANQGYTLLGSPSTTSAPKGLEWIQEWLGQISLKPTHICVHWYDVGFDKFQAYMENFYNNTGNINLMVTEFACQNFNGGAQCSQDDIWNFVHQAVSWMDSTSWIDGYAPFGALYLARIVSHIYSYFFSVLRLHEGHARRERSGPAHERRRHPECSRVVLHQRLLNSRTAAIRTSWLGLLFTYPLITTRRLLVGPFLARLIFVCLFPISNALAVLSTLTPIVLFDLPSVPP